MLDALLEVVLPVFIVAGAGFVYAGHKDLPIAGMTDLILHLTGACLVFDALSTAEPFGLDAARVPASAALVILGGALLAALARRLVPGLSAMSAGAVVLPVAFMNAGNLGLPLVTLAFGQEGLQLGMLYFVTSAFLMYSVGIGVVAGPGGAWAGLKLPLVHGAALGLAVNQLELTVPETIARPIHLLGLTVVPLMLLSLGGRLRTLITDRRGLPLAAIAGLVLLRMGGGFLLALAANAVLGNRGMPARVVALVGMLPPAVMNFMLVEKFGGRERDSAAVSGAIAVGTALALVVLPPAVEWARTLD